MAEEDYDGAAILSLPMDENDAEAETVKDYLTDLLWSLWAQGEGFSGKRPFGNSGWEHDLYRPLVRASMIAGEIDEYGDIHSIDKETGNSAIFAAIAAL